jgi:hypothetical protein
MWEVEKERDETKLRRTKSSRESKADAKEWIGLVLWYQKVQFFSLV